MPPLVKLAGSLALAFVSIAALADPPTPGTRGAVVADPVLPPPPGTPCVATLYTDEVFNDFSLHDFDYAPPAHCPGPYTKVILRADFSVTTGRQFDRTANLWIGGVNLYFGTTQEPSAAVAPTWRIERDISDYQSLLSAANRGKIDLGNVVNDTYTGILHGSAQILFYPDVANWPDRPRRPDRVIALAGGELGGVTDLNGSSARFEKTLTFPTNVERVFMDVVAQSQAGDEFWMTCVPDEFGDALQSCPGTAFRETQVTIDGVPAGIAPIYPWLYTGAIDPSVWRPIPGIQTLSFRPWRVDLSPFAATLNDGQPHAVALSVFNARDHFSMAANLLLYLDAGSTRVGGAVTRNTLAAAPSPAVSHASQQNGDITASTVNVSSLRSHTVTGYVDTSRGRVETSIEQESNFRSNQQFEINDSIYRQHIDQLTHTTTTTRISYHGRTNVLRDEAIFPLKLNIDYEESDTGAKQTTTVDQQYNHSVRAGTEGFESRQANVYDTVTNADTLLLTPEGALAGRQDWRGNHISRYDNPFGQCYSRDVRSRDGAVTEVFDGNMCPSGQNTLSWFDEFHNYASNIFGASVPAMP
ncbi:MAG TPA: peptide-N4-asparagine amidase [Tahibacter sp.]|nr:peptide-N4-asparagine amidase [Tahibacter sp.]